MKDLLWQVLIKEGFQEVSKEESNELWHKIGSADEDLIFDLDKMEVCASISESKHVDITTTVEQEVNAGSESEAQRIGKSIVPKKEQELQNELQEKYQRQIERKLADSEEVRRKLLNGLIQQVYAQSLKTKAGRMGNIMSINESTNSEGEYELVIKVEQ